MLIFVLPLKITFAAWFSYLSGGWLPSLTLFGTLEQLRQLFIAYGLGFTLMETCLGGLYLHAWRQRVLLALNQVEQAHTQYTLGRGAVGIGVGLLAVAAALVVPPQYATLTAWCYALLMPLNPLLRRRRNRQLQRLQTGSAG
jgi:hypothetical protein